MGWSKKNFVRKGQRVRVLIVAERKNIHLEFALKVIPDVKFIKT